MADYTANNMTVKFRNTTVSVLSGRAKAKAKAPRPLPGRAHSVSRTHPCGRADTCRTAARTRPNMHTHLHVRAVQVGDLYDRFVAAGATNASVPDMPTTANLTTFAIDYDLVSWSVRAACRGVHAHARTNAHARTSEGAASRVLAGPTRSCAPRSVACSTSRTRARR
jgi:hypothetical protein